MPSSQLYNAATPPAPSPASTTKNLYFGYATKIMTKAIARIISALLILLEITIIRIASSPAISTNKKKLYHRLLIFDPAAHTAADSIIITAVFDTSAGCTPIGPKRIQRVAPLAVLPNGISARINNSDSAKNAGAIFLKTW